MDALSLLLLSVGLAMDAVAVSAARGIGVQTIRISHALRVGLFFGGFQALMPLVGWLLGAQVGPWVQAWDHWIAFALLGGLGAKMVLGAWRAEPGEDARASPETEADPFGWRVMTLLAVATSIDALAAGLTLPVLNAPLWASLASIGLTTAALSVAGLYAGRRLGAHLGPRLDLVGGLVLIGLGGKVLVEHLGVA